MFVSSPLLTELMEALRCLPGVGAKTAQRMAFHLLERDRHSAKHLAQKLVEATERIGYCQQCRTFSETPICVICSSSNRDHALLCVVETAVDQLMIEQATGFRGYYFVLGGRLSPLDGIGPQQLGMQILFERLSVKQVTEVIIATNPTIEGEATAHYITQMARSVGIKTSCLAHGVPLGGELEFIDHNTLAHAFGMRQSVE